MTTPSDRLREIEERVEKVWVFTKEDMRWLVSRVKELEARIDQYEKEDIHEAMGCYQEDEELKGRLAVAVRFFERIIKGQDQIFNVCADDLAREALGRISDMGKIT